MEEPPRGGRKKEAVQAEEENQYLSVREPIQGEGIFPGADNGDMLR